MVTNYYNSSNNFSSPVRREPKPYIPPAKREPLDAKPCSKEQKFQADTDTILIFGLIILLVMSGCDDTLLLIALGFLIFF